MTLVSKLGLVLKAILIVFFTTVQESRQGFIFLNYPETLTTTGVLHQKTFQEKTKLRYFFHYKNGTNKGQKFYITTKEKVENLKKAITTHSRPEIAGINSAKNFFITIPSNEKLNLSSYIEPNSTISGFIEGSFQKLDTITYKFGNTDNKIETFNVWQKDYEINYNYNLITEKIITHRLGERTEDSIPGQYGQNVNITLMPKQSGIMKLSFSPRGGAGLLIFSHRGKIYSTKLLPALSRNDVLYISVEKDKAEKFTFIPVGGLNYPISLDFSLNNIFLENGIA